MRKPNNDYMQKGPIARLPVILKVMFIKFWLGGAVFFFLGFGTPALHSHDQLDLALALGLVLGLATDIIVNRLFRHLDGAKKEYSKYTLFNTKKFISMPVNLLIYVVISFLIAFTYNFINIAYLRNNPEVSSNYVFLSAEPLLYGIFFLVYDMTFLVIKKLFLRIFRRKSHEIS
ncbi:MAG: hypothetical protein FWD82_02440 [Defluviitaleaceae bacterium]|nr:hypothetical protein [Defluviitaleaceae bacterium]